MITGIRKGTDNNYTYMYRMFDNKQKKIEREILYEKIYSNNETIKLPWPNVVIQEKKE